jgi:subtilase family serine protease
MLLKRFAGSKRPRSGVFGGIRTANAQGPIRFFRPEVEQLEDRLAMSSPKSVGPIVLPDQSAAPPSGAITPAQMRHAYGIDQVTFGGVSGDGSGQTIAIIAIGDNPSFVSSTDPGFDTSSLHMFDEEFGLPDPPNFIKLNGSGQQSNYPTTSSGSVETALDVEWAHSIAPAANIVLIEVQGQDNFVTQGVALATSIPQVSVVSMSYAINPEGGTGEFAGETALDQFFTTPSGHQGITFVASSGDSGSYPNQSTTRVEGYPASSPNVLSVGGTTLSIDGEGNYIGETAWGNGSQSSTLGGSGGGISEFEPQPAYQKGVVTQSTTMRTVPDVAFDADPNTGVAIYDSFDFGTATPWVQIGGTSLSAPCWAGIIAIADQDRARIGLGTLDGPTQTLPKIYSLPDSDFHDITSGSNGSYSAGPGYDLVTGRGTPIAQLLIPDLAGVPNFVASQQIYHPFRYIVDATLPQNGSVFEGNLTVVNPTTETSTSQFVLLLGPLPDGVTLDPTVPTTTLSNGEVGIPLPLVGLPTDVPIRVQLQFLNPKHVAISTFFEGFSVTLTPEF